MLSPVHVGILLVTIPYMDGCGSHQMGQLWSALELLCHEELLDRLLGELPGRSEGPDRVRFGQWGRARANSFVVYIIPYGSTYPLRRYGKVIADTWRQKGPAINLRRWQWIPIGIYSRAVGTVNK